MTHIQIKPLRLSHCSQVSVPSNQKQFLIHQSRKQVLERSPSDYSKALVTGSWTLLKPHFSEIRFCWQALESFFFELREILSVIPKFNFFSASGAWKPLGSLPRSSFRKASHRLPLTCSHLQRHCWYQAHEPHTECSNIWWLSCYLLFKAQNQAFKMFPI